MRGSRQCAGPLIKNEPAGCQMVCKTVVHQIARPETGGKQCTCTPPRIRGQPHGFENRAWRHEHPAPGFRPAGCKSSKRRVGCLQVLQVAFTEHGQTGQSLSRDDLAGKHFAQMALPARRCHRIFNLLRQILEQLRLTQLLITSLELIKKLVHDVSSNLP